jgi:putative ABC transport system permease protein
MIINFLKITFRGLIRQKLYTIINISGLAIGLTCTIIIGLYVLNEFSFDKFHKNADRIYRITLKGRLGTNFFRGPVSSSPMAKTLTREFPEVESAVRLFPLSNRCIQCNNKTNYEDKFLYADSNFFNIFNFNFIIGEPQTALNKFNSAVITKSTAQRYFGNGNPIGKTFKIINSNSIIYEIKGIIEDMPENSHFHFDFIASSRAVEDANNSYWINNNNYTYFVLKKGFDPQTVESKLPDLVKRYVIPQFLKFSDVKSYDFNSSKYEYTFHIQKLTDIHLHSNLDYELEPNGSITYIYIFIIVAMFILLIACINFINLSTAYSVNRAKEVGIRKVLGSSRKYLIIQFLSETILLCFIAVIIAMFLSELLIPIFNNLLYLKLNFNILENKTVIPIIIGFSIITGIIAGGYPSFYLSRFAPIEVLKDMTNKKATKATIRNILVVFQFCISIIIILGTITIYNQLRFLQNKKLGFDKDQIIVIERTDPIKKDIGKFIADLKGIDCIKAVSLSSGTPGRIYSNSSFILDSSSNRESFLLSFLFTDYDYLKTMGINLALGRFFSYNIPSDTSAIVINESAARYLGIKSPIGHKLIAPAPVPDQRKVLTIIGIVKDFHFESLHKNINPLLLVLTKNSFDGYVSVRIASGRNKAVLQDIQSTWYKYSKNAPLIYFYFNHEFNKLYKSEYKIRGIMSLFSFLAIFIAYMGLFGLIAYTTKRRTKEIGIRKVMGSSVFKIIVLLSKDTAILVLIAAVIAIPIAWYFMFLWLEDYAYRIKINLLIFLLICVIALVISLMTIMIQAYYTARRNPIEALRYE